MKERWIVVPEWDTFQHYKDRDPKWIKVYNSLLHNDDYLDLTGHQRAVLHGIWLAYASGHCQLRANAQSLSRRLSLRITTRDLSTLADAGWITIAAEPVKRENDWASRYVSKELRERVLDRDAHKCRDCGSEENLEIDHILPISRGGDTVLDNLQTLCRSCNRKKHNGASVPGLSSNSRPREEVEVREKKELARERAKTQTPEDKIRAMIQNGVITDEVDLEAELRAHGAIGVLADVLRAELRIRKESAA